MTNPRAPLSDPPLLFAQAKPRELWKAAYAGDEVLVADLLGCVADPDDARGDGRTALFWAAYLGHQGIVASLLTAGAVVDRADGNGTTPLMTAAQGGHAGVCSQLLAAGGGGEREGRAREYCAGVCEGL